MLGNRPVSPGLIFVVFCLCVEGQSEGATVTADVLLQDGKGVPSFLAGASVGEEILLILGCAWSHTCTYSDQKFKSDVFWVPGLAAKPGQN